MSAVILGNNNVVRHGHLEMWAERGLIRIHDTRDGSVETVSVRTTLQRMKALQDMLFNKGSDNRREANTEDQFDQANRDRIQRMLEGMIQVCERAKAQGMPTDASARRDLARRAPRTVVVPGTVGSM